MTNRANPTLDVIRAAMALAERDVELGLVTADQIQAIPRTRFAPVERKHVAALLKAEGKSNREIARELGVASKTIDRDLTASNDAEGASNDAPKKPRAAPPAPEAGCTLEDLGALITSGRKFGAIYADPPWLYDNQGTRAATSNHYDGMTVEQLCELPIRNLAADNAHLHLWTTNAFLFDCPKIFDAWGFEFRSSLVWVKPQMGIGNYWRNSHEILLTAIRGDAKRFNDKSLKSWIECDRGAHSAKPEQVRTFLERASHGPYLELFGRRPADGWVVWGNQVERNIFSAGVEEGAPKPDDELLDIPPWLLRTRGAGQQ